MSTRATYSFETELTNKPIVFYIHSDNYPEGAAYYFWQMHKHRHYKGGLGEIFCKANANATQFTEGHEWHGDTEYRYYMDKNGQLMVEKFVYEPKKTFVSFFRGHYAEFVNQYSETLEEENKFERLYRLSDDLMIDEYLLHERLQGYHTSYYGYLTLSEVKAVIVKLLTGILDENSSDNWRTEALSKWGYEYQRLLKCHSKHGDVADMSCKADKNISLFYVNPCSKKLN